jgi:hypothetical protein
LVLFPEVFLRPRDEYLYAFLRKLAEEEGKNLSVGVDEQPQVETVDVYLGNIHVSPVSRLWNT